MWRCAVGTSWGTAHGRSWEDADSQVCLGWSTLCSFPQLLLAGSTLVNRDLPHWAHRSSGGRKRHIISKLNLNQFWKILLLVFSNITLLVAGIFCCIGHLFSSLELLLTLQQSLEGSLRLLFVKQDIFWVGTDIFARSHTASYSFPCSTVVLAFFQIKCNLHLFNETYWCYYHCSPIDCNAALSITVPILSSLVILAWLCIYVQVLLFKLAYNIRKEAWQN